MRLRVLHNQCTGTPAYAGRPGRRPAQRHRLRRGLARRTTTSARRSCRCSDESADCGAVAATEEHERLEEARTGAVPWKAWGPYLSERQWGTVREDYSAGGDAWSVLPARPGALARLPLGRGRDRGHLRRAPAAVPGARAVERRRPDPQGAHVRPHQRRGQPRRGRQGVLVLPRQHADALVPEVPLQVPAARRSRTTTWSPTNGAPRQAGARVRAARHRHLRRGPLLRRRRRVRQGRAATTSCMLVTAHNRGPDAATLHLLPTLWFRNTWSWGDDVAEPALRRRRRARASGGARRASGARRRGGCCADDGAQLLFCENETNNERLFGVAERVAVRQGRRSTTTSCGGAAGAVNPARTGTKVAAHHVLEIAAGRERASIRVRLTRPAQRRTAEPLGGGLRPRARRAPRGGRRVLRDGDPAGRSSADAALVMRQALAGHAVVQAVLRVRRPPLAARARRQPVGPGAPARDVRNVAWFHMVAGDVISMPDKWEYPWFAAWDLAFHCAPLSLVDVDFAKEQVELLLRTPLPAPQRPDPGLRVELQRRQPAGARRGRRCSSTSARREIRGEGDREFLAARVRAAADRTSPGGSTARTPTAATCSRAASSASTTSASSTARRRCPAAARSSRPTARRGWRSTASGCCRSRSSWPGTTRSTPTWR